MELRQYFNVLLKWWWLILASVVVAAVASYLGSLATPRTYQSRTTLMVGQVLQNPNPNQTDIYTGQALAQSYSDLVRREPVLRGTLEALKLNWDWNVLQGMVSSRVVPGTQLLEIIVVDTYPERAKALAAEVTRQLILQSPSNTDPEQNTERQFVLTQVEDLKANIKKSQDEIHQLDSLIAQANSAREIQDARTRQASLQSQISTWQATYAQLLLNLQQRSTNFLSIVEPAQVPSAPVGSGTAVNVLLAAAIGLILSSSAAFLLEYLDDTIKTTDDVRQILTLNTLGSVAHIDGDNDQSRLVAVLHPRSLITEMYRGLRTNIQFRTVDDSLRSLIITSPNPGEGKSLTSANLAVVLAQSGKRVILVDADLRRPSQHRMFSLSNRTGLTSILLDANERLSDVLQMTGVENLRVMTSGPIPPNPSEVLGSKRMGYLIEALQQEADVTIFDSPPVMAVTDSLVLAGRLDGMLLVIEAGRTRRIDVQRSKEASTNLGVRILGVVINQLPIRDAGHYSYYYAEDRARLASETPNTLLMRLRRIIASRGGKLWTARHKTSKSTPGVASSKSKGHVTLVETQTEPTK